MGKVAKNVNEQKTFPEKPHGTLSPNIVLMRNWQYIAIDLITSLPPSMGYDVVVDRLSKMIRVVATNGEVTSEGVARIFRDRV